MQPYHAEAIVNAEGKIVLTLPFRAGEKVDVLVVLSDDEERSWQELVARKFFEEYSDEDAAYDNYKV